MRWWAKCISMVIAKTASRNVVFKTDVMSQAVLETQASFVTPQPTDQGLSAKHHLLYVAYVGLHISLLVFHLDHFNIDSVDGGLQTSCS